MKLKGITAHGFKSFADKIDLEFKSNITAIVGPNGSGKSNIVDAIRWVLGEQSVKSLRGSKDKVDVIFAGSETRKPLKRAEVSLRFDNSDPFLNTELEEVEVKRVLYHTGENEYYINNQQVRLKDITSLFLDSGIGNTSLNIIGQGSIEAIVNSKPIDRRFILEGASKVLKYKTRKTESTRKLEKTKDNLEKVDLVLDELKHNLEPLKEQSVIAKRYLSLQKDLKELDISLAASDISKLHDELESVLNNQKKLEFQLDEKKKNASKETGDIEAWRLKVIKLEEEMQENQNIINHLTEEIAEKESQKKILIEEQKYKVNQDIINDNYLQLKKKEQEIKQQKEVSEFVLTKKKEEVLNIQNEVNEKKKAKMACLENQEQVTKEYQSLLKEQFNLQNQIKYLENSLLEDKIVPSSVKNVLHNPRLKGIHGTIGSLLEVPKEYVLAADIALGSGANFVIVDDDNNAKLAINYLKENHLGRVTFFPLNIIKSRKIKNDNLDILTKDSGYLGILSDLLTYDKKYQAIMENQLGNILVVKTMNDMSRIGKALDYKYRIVTLDGEILHAGGSLTGGTVRKQNSILKDKLNLDSKQTEIKKITNKISDMENKIKDIEQKDQTISKEYNNLMEALIVKTKEQEQLVNQCNQLNKDFTDLLEELERCSSLKENQVEKTIASLMEKTTELSTEKELNIRKLNSLREQRNTLSSKIEEQDFLNKKKNSEIHQLETSFHDEQLKQNKIEMKMDHLLELLSENYHITYEKAKVDYPLEIDEFLAREQLGKIKKEMQTFGMVNLGSIDEYDRMKGRTDFLEEQKNDLTTSILELENIIMEMDQIMIERLTVTFDKIKDEFSEVFGKLFKGGKGILKLTDPDNILESGIEIIAEPPGKRLNNIALLSGGEKTLTAIALLFAILHVFPVPFCVLDEVEAALDEANVDTFGLFLQELKEKSEYILITHKKRTMEYADTLYGITMQEQGVSKIVSVKLEEN